MTIIVPCLFIGAIAIMFIALAINLQNFWLLIPAAIFIYLFLQVIRPKALAIFIHIFKIGK